MSQTGDLKGKKKYLSKSPQSQFKITCSTTPSLYVTSLKKKFILKSAKSVYNLVN